MHTTEWLALYRRLMYASMITNLTMGTIADPEQLYSSTMGPGKWSWIPFFMDGKDPIPKY